jgi:hypothetical protein
VTEADLTKELELLWLRHVHGARDTKESLDDVCGGISLTTERHDDVYPILALTVHSAGERERNKDQGEAGRERERR